MKTLFTAIGQVVLMGILLVYAALVMAIGGGIGYALAYVPTASTSAGIIGAGAGATLVLCMFMHFTRPTPVAPAYRHPIPLNVRAAVIARDAFACRHCGSTDVGTFQIDHVIPYSKGGTDDISNLQTLCAHCNESKGNRYVG